uniref:Putative ixodes 26 kDa salivary protein n=1 Tax=Ixodes ricinus TaxID=34613 RepID=A0A0K8RKR2_IXORI
MTVLARALTLALCIFCSAAEPRTRSASRRGVSGAKTITIAYLLDGNDFQNEDASPDSEVGKWLKKVQEKAEMKLHQATGVKIKFNTTDRNVTNPELTKNLLSWTSAGSCGSESLMNAGVVLAEIKEESTTLSARPHIICVLTKQRLYQGELINLMGLALQKSLCITMVPMILTYDQSSDNVENTGNLMSELVVNSTVPDNGKTWEEYFNMCNKNRLFTTQYFRPLVRSSKSQRIFRRQ